MKILADENIAQVSSFFARHGELRTAPGRAIDAAMALDVDALLLRSVTRVDASLLAGSRCRFVASATSGTDHVDLAWLQEQDIAFADAHGCNAGSVVDYVLSALAVLALESGEDWRLRRVGIVGCGAVGSRLARRLLALGMDVKIHDPFLDTSHPLAHCFSDLHAVLRRDIVSLHVPLTRSGPWPTWQLLDAAALQCLPADAILINAARGGVIDEAALTARLDACPGMVAVLDTWCGEPAIDTSLHARVRLGTAHIAGYSSFGKLLGTRMVHEAFCRHFGIDASVEPVVDGGQRILDLGGISLDNPCRVLNHCLVQAYDVREDHARLAEVLAAAQPAQGFDALRRHYPLRLECGQYCLPRASLAPELERVLLAAGFSGGEAY